MTTLFWTIIAALLGASAFLGVGAETRRRELQAAKGAVASGDLVAFVSVVDGDTVLVRTEAAENVTVRIVGVKAFDADAKDDTGAFGQRAIDELSRALGQKSIRVELNDPPRDAHGRTLATLYVDEEDVGLSLVRSGTSLVYTAHPFPAMAAYLQEQGVARGERRGLWANAEATARADGLARQWRARAR
jgi:endonuclease YncB( thermonuclease family)